MKQSGQVSSAGTHKNFKDYSEYGAKARSNDIREHGVKDEPLSSGAAKQIKRELAPTPGTRYSSVKSDADLHTDTTDYSEKDAGGFSNKNNHEVGEPLNQGAKAQVERELKPTPSGRYRI